jgi:hypothetical protein
MVDFGPCSLKPLKPAERHVLCPQEICLLAKYNKGGRGVPVLERQAFRSVIESMYPTQGLVPAGLASGIPSHTIRQF